MRFLEWLHDGFVAVEPGSIRGLIGLGDLLRSIVLGLIGFGVTTLIAVLPLVSTYLIPLIPNPPLDAALVWGVAVVLDLLRRLHSGTATLLPPSRIPIGPDGHLIMRVVQEDGRPITSFRPIAP